MSCTVRWRAMLQWLLGTTWRLNGAVDAEEGLRAHPEHLRGQA